ncbi:MAG: CPBP family intramembrane glutamic endopeptidase [Candidatus Dormiibacterota bacterium]
MATEALGARLHRYRAAPWWPTATVLVIGELGLGAALLIPITFSDPNGVDPYLARLSVASVLITLPSLFVRRLEPARPILLALAAVAATYTLLAAGPQILFDLLGTHSGSFDAQVFWASFAQAAGTLLIALAAIRLVAPEWRPSLRLRHLSLRGLATGVLGSALLIGIGLALPANLLGRVALQPVAFGRDLPWLGPANALQAFSQEVQFRGLLLGALERTMSPRWANVSQAAVFGLAHLAISYGGPEAPFVPITFLVGLAFGWLVRRTNSLWPAVILHAVADIALQFGIVQGLYGL